MAISRSLLTLFKFVFPFTDFLYILQLEEYDYLRFLNRIPRFLYKRDIQIREHLQYTSRMTMLMMVVALLYVAICAVIFTLFGWWIIVVSILLTRLVFPIIIVGAHFLVLPFDALEKYRIIKKCNRYLLSTGHSVKIIAVAGSYGKTTTKSFIHQLIKYNFRTQVVPGNINTVIGISRWLLNNFKSSSEVLIVEIDTYALGEIRRICKLLPPDIAVITSIGSQHLERFHSPRYLTRAIHEAFAFAKPGARTICNNEVTSQIVSIGLTPPTDSISRQGEIDYNGRVIQTTMSISNQDNLRLSLRVAGILSIPQHIIANVIETISIPDRRQKVSVWHGYNAVDDSYNIAYPTAEAGIAVAKDLAQASQKKLLVVTAGIPEADGPNENIKLGRLLAMNVDHVVVLNSIFSPLIIKGLDQYKQYGVYPGLQEFLQIMHRDFPREQWVILLQPELNDLYY